MQCKEWDDANSELFKESHDEAVHKNSYKSRLYELISASLGQHTIPLIKTKKNVTCRHYVRMVGLRGTNCSTMPVGLLMARSAISFARFGVHQ